MRTGGAHDLVVLAASSRTSPGRRTSGCARRSSTSSAARRSSPSGRPPRPCRTRGCRWSSAAPPTPSWPAGSALSAPSYQGVTGLVGVLHAELERPASRRSRCASACRTTSGTSSTRWPSAALRPPPRPRARRARRRRPRRGRRPLAALHDEVVADDEQLQAYVRMLEPEYDRRAEAILERPTTSPAGSRSTCANSATTDARGGPTVSPRRPGRLRARRVRPRRQGADGVPPRHRPGRHRHRRDAGHHAEGRRLRPAGRRHRLHRGDAPPVRRPRPRPARRRRLRAAALRAVGARSRPASAASSRCGRPGARRR